MGCYGTGTRVSLPPRKPINGIPAVPHFMAKKRKYICPVEAAIDVVGGKWKPLILWVLRDATLRFSEIEAEFPTITQKTLTRQLRDLERDGLITRKVYPESPPRVEYTITPNGLTVVPILESLRDWASGHLADSIECED